MRALTDELRRGGIDAWVDQYVSSPPEGWPAWTRTQVMQCDFVVVVCTAEFRRRFDREGTTEVGKGVMWEALITEQLLYDAGARNEKVIPVVLPEAEDEDVPLALRPYTRYRLPEEHERLLRRLTGQPEIEVPPLGEIRVLPPKPRVGLGVSGPGGGGAESSLRGDRGGAEITDDALVDQLARVIWDADEARLVAQRAGFPPARIPAFRTAMVFWSKMVEEARHGAIGGGVAAVAVAAAKQYPANAVFSGYRPSR